MEVRSKNPITCNRKPKKRGRAKIEATVSLGDAKPRSFRLVQVLVALVPPRICGPLAMLLLAMATTSCGSFVARRMTQSPNSYPEWFGSLARVELAFDQDFLTNFPAHFVEVGPPSARLYYRIVEPADYHLQISSTNRLKRGRSHLTFGFHTTLPGQTNAWTSSPRGTVVLLHGYGLAQFAMTPWAMRLAEEGWRCVLVDLRGHGKSTGQKIHFGLQETLDLSQLMDAMARDGPLVEPVVAVGESYGAALALRWMTVEPRLASVVAIAPYAVLSNAVLNLCCDYAGWLPVGLVKAGLKQLPAVLKVETDELDTMTVLARSPVVALFVAGADDKIATPAAVKRLYEQAAQGSELLMVAHATHEALPYYFDDLLPAVSAWLERQNGVRKTTVGSQKSD